MIRRLLPLAVFVVAGGCAPEAPLRLQEVDGVVLDELGRGVLLRGVNARVNGVFDVTFDDGRVPLEAIPSFGAEDCRFLAREMGFNLLRLPINWSGVEPERDRFDADYLDRVFAVVDACHAEGVWTLVDIHQDAYSKEIGEDGAPLWAIVPAPTELLEGPLEDLEERRSSIQVLAAFASLWDDEEGLVDEFADMAAEVASRFADHPGAVGLELFNEPVAIARIDQLDAFHDRVTQRVREVAPDVLVAFEPEAFRNFTDVAEIGATFPHDNAIYAPHVYTDVFEDGWESEDESAVQDSIDGTQWEAGVHSSALLVGEFGHDPQTERGLRYIRTCLDGFDRVRAGWAFWVYEEYSQGSWGLYSPAVGPGGEVLETRGELRPEIADLLARPFPTRAAGTVNELAWDEATATLTVELLASGTRSEHTVVSAPSRTWPNGVEGTCDGEPVEVVVEAGRATVPCAAGTLRLGPAGGSS